MSDPGTWEHISVPSLIKDVYSESTGSSGSPTPSSHPIVSIDFFPAPPTTNSRMARTSEWVQSQLAQGQIRGPETEEAHDPEPEESHSPEPEESHSPEPDTRRAQPTTPPPRAINREDEPDTPQVKIQVHTDPPRAEPSVHQGAPKRTYDVATLLAMRYTQSAVPVMLRVKPEAIAGELPITI